MKERLKLIINNRNFFLVILALIVTIPIFISNDIPVSHDILFHLSRVKGINYEINNNIFFSPIYHNFLYNLGYACPMFYPDIFLYPFAFLYKFLNLVYVYKLMIFSINLFTVYTINFILTKVFKEQKIIKFGTILYTFMPYRLVDLYLRGNIGESLSFIFIPFIVLGLEELVNRNKKKYYYIIIGMTGIIYSHIVSSYLVFIFIFLYLLLNIRKIFKENRYLYLLKAVVITFLLSSSFLLPLLEQMTDREFFIHYLDQMHTFNNTTVPIYKLFFEIPLPSSEWIPLGIGIIYLYFIILGVKYYKILTYDKLIYVILGIIFLISTTNLIPSFIYNKILIYIQYQWRFYFLATICLFFFGLKIINLVNDKEYNWLKKMMYASIIIVLTNVVTTNTIYEKTDDVYKEYLGFYEYLPNGVDVSDVYNNRIKSSVNNHIIYSDNYDIDRLIIKYSNNVYDDTILTLPLLYYKGYTTNKEYDIINNNGLVAVKLNKIEDNFEVYYEGTNIMVISRIITLITIVFIICYYYRMRGEYVKT